MAGEKQFSPSSNQRYVTMDDDQYEALLALLENSDGSGYPLTSAGVPSNGVREIVLVRLDNTVSEGTYRLNCDGEITAPIAYDATASQIAAAIAALSNVGTGNAESHGSGSGGGFLNRWVRFVNDLDLTDVPDVTLEDDDTDGNVTVSIQQQGITATGRDSATGTMAVDTLTGDVYANVGTPGAPSWVRVYEAGGGGGLSIVDLGVVNIVDLLDGPQTIYEPDNQYFSIVSSTVFTHPDSQNIQVIQDELPLTGDPNRVLLRLTTNVNTPPSQSSPPPAPMISSIAVVAGLQTANSGYFLDEALGVWQSAHVYGNKNCILAESHIWSSTAGTSDASAPDFASNLGGTVTDNDITWTDEGAIPTTGSIHLYGLVS